MSEYSTPKVTIDLAEYTELLDKVSQHDKDDEIVMAKEVALAVLQNASAYGRPIMDAARNTLDEKGISFWVTTHVGTLGLGQIHTIQFKRIDKKNKI